MPKIKSLEELRKIREEAQKDIRVRTETGTRIIVGMGTCGIAAGARDVMQAILKELEKQDIEAHVETVGCIGMCAKEPLVDIEQAGKPRVTYGNVSPEMVPRLVEEHLKQGRAVPEWAIGRLDSTGIQ
jgi:NADP-reducing hydrogenase subunit HndB